VVDRERMDFVRGTLTGIFSTWRRQAGFIIVLGIYERQIGVLFCPK
jgi:hypothetical protein